MTCGVPKVPPFHSISLHFAPNLPQSGTLLSLLHRLRQPTALARPGPLLPAFWSAFSVLGPSSYCFMFSVFAVSVHFAVSCLSPTLPLDHFGRPCYSVNTSHRPSHVHPRPSHCPSILTFKGPCLGPIPCSHFRLSFSLLSFFISFPIFLFIFIPFVCPILHSVFFLLTLSVSSHFLFYLFRLLSSSSLS